MPSKITKNLTILVQICSYFSDFNQFSLVQSTPEPINPCNPSPCGVNAICKERNGVGSCTCLHEYYGDPYNECRPECTLNSDCAKNRACVNNKCRDPCPGVCGINAECSVINHSPTCSCLDGYIGNALTACHEKPKSNFLSNI